MRCSAIALCATLLPVALSGQVTRWAIRIESPAGIEHGELRLGSNGGALLLESRDTAYLKLAQFTRSAGRITFSLPSLAARVVADLSADTSRMEGWFTAANGARRLWQGEWIVPGTERWPVRPRLRARQLLFGSSTDVTIIPASWVVALPDSGRLEREYGDLVERSGLIVLPASARSAHTQALVLGWDAAGRTAARRVLETIAAGPAADAAFRELFVTDDGLRLDVHERAEEDAARRYRDFRYPDAARALVLDGWLPSGVVGELTRSRETMLTLWSRWHDADSTTMERLGALQARDRVAWRALTALLAGYDQAVPWWREAVGWLMEHPWLETANGFRSPAQLVAAWWGDATLAAPAILPVVTGGYGAAPWVNGERLGRRLMDPLNASARDWLDRGPAEALATWRALAWDDTLTVESGVQSAQLLSPATATQRWALRSLVADMDAVEIEPGILPIFAVVTMIHEWHHLVATASRLSGTGVGLRAYEGALHLRDEDPWLAEGFAEWATEETLRPVRATLPLLTLIDAEKRMGLWGGMSDDPHAMGYRLVRTAASRLPVATRRSAIVNRLHDAASLARLVGFPSSSRTGPLLLRRPKTMAVIPEVTFTWDAGVADSPSRRLLLPLFPPER